MTDLTPDSWLNTVFTMIGNLLAAHDSQKKGLFENHVEPLQKKMEAIHKDYIAGFAELRRHLEDRSKPRSELISFLEDRRRDYAIERDLAQHVAASLADAERRPVRPDAWAALRDYCEAVSDYFFYPSQFAHKTWFSRYLEKVRANIHFGQADVWRDPTIYGIPKGEHARTELINMATVILDRELPEAFGAIGSNYAKLRVLLL